MRLHKVAADMPPQIPPGTHEQTAFQGTLYY